jgi:hypothetical protein
VWYFWAVTAVLLVSPILKPSLLARIGILTPSLISGLTGAS